MQFSESKFCKYLFFLLRLYLGLLLALFVLFSEMNENAVLATKSFLKAEVAESDFVPFERIFFRRFGVSCEFDLNKQEYRFFFRQTNKKLLLLSILAEEFSLEDAWAELELLETEIEERIKSHYGVRVSHCGELTSASPVRSRRSSYKLRLRSPMLLELSALETAIEHSVPSFYLRSSHEKSLKVYFLQDWNYCAARADWGFDYAGKPAIFVEPAFANAGNFAFLKEVFLHELAHNASYNMGFRPKNPGAWKLSKKLGWFYFFNPNARIQGFAIESSDGRLFRQGNSSRWIRCDRSGLPLSKAGERVRLRDAERLGANQIRELANVRPVSAYFPNPMEVMAEGLCFFRNNRACRRRLLVESPKLYSIVKEEDQNEIDKSFGRSKYLRGLDGRLLQATEKNRRLVEKFESQSSLLAGLD